MKHKYITICLSALLCGTTLQSCTDWLDVRPSETLLQKDLFKDPEGFRVALNGVYRLVSSRELYGENLTWGFASLLAQHYSGTNYLIDIQMRVAAYEWGYAGVRQITEAIWARSYFTLANVNNLIQETEKKDGGFFLNGQQEKDLILGEMYGMRALLHFEMIRLFAPSPAAGLDVPAVPYVATYPDRQPERRTLDEALGLAIEDMKRACTLLRPLDTEAFATWMNNVNYRFVSAQHAAAWSDFFNYRGVRMNYYAAEALLARMYLWQGDKEEAYNSAKKVYDAHKAGVFAWTPAGNLSSANPGNVHTKRWNEILLAFYDQKAYDNYEQVCNQGPYNSFLPMFTMKNVDALFGTETNDYRYAGLYRNGLYLTYRRPTETSAAAVDIATFQGPLLTVIRFPEMYHIMIEHLIDRERFDEARALSAELRLARGTDDSRIPADNADHSGNGTGDFTDFLINDMIREGLTEGQVFYMFKRLNRNIFNGATDVAMTPEKFTPGYPDNETSYVLE